MDKVSEFNTFSQLCKDHGLLERAPELEAEDSNEGLNDDTNLLRFLRARSFIPTEALKQYQDALRIRRVNNALQLYESITVEDYEATRKLYPHWSGRRDKRGLPICIFDLAFLDNSTMSEYKKTRNSHTLSSEAQKYGSPNATQRAIVFHDTLTRFIIPLCSYMKDRPALTTPVTSAIYLVDISTFSLKQAWDLKSYAQDISKMLATSYPEVVDQVFVLNAPSYFGTIWSFLKKWLDPVTASKLVILKNSEVLSTLTQFIDLENIPTRYGGNFEFAHGMLPDLDKGISNTLQWISTSNTLPPGPLKWTQDKSGIRTAISSGSVQGKTRHQAIATLV